MTRNIIGQLIIKLSEQGSKATSKAIRSDLDAIEARARALGQGKWGAGFQSQLDKLKLSPTQLAAVKASFDRIPTDINGALKKAEIGKWRTSVLGHFSAIEAKATGLTGVLNKLAGSPVFHMLVGYGGYQIARNGLVAGAERDRTIFRLDQAGLPEKERAQLLNKAEELSGKYPGMNMTDIAELGLRSYSTMGDMDRATAILEAEVQGQIALMSARGVDKGGSIMDRIMKAADILGQNASGPEGIANVVAMIDGLVRAAQVEGEDFDPGAIVDFARRAKTAGAGWSTDFIANYASAIMQDLGGPAAGTALASAFKSFVLGDNQINGKVYRQRQYELGIRDRKTDEIVGAELFTTNPFLWTQQYLIPALQKAGVDTSDDGAVARAVGKLSGSSTATAQLTRFIQQQDQMLKSMGLYQRAQGLDGADKINRKDPFVAWRGFLNSFENLSGALAEHINIIAPALDTMASGINALSTAVRKNPWMGGVAGGGAALGLLGGLKVGSWVLKAATGGFGLQAAGVSLQTAAVMLERAAVAQGGGSVAGGVGAGGKPGARTTDDALKMTFPLLAPVIADAVGNWVEDTFMGGRTPKQQEVLSGALGRVVGRIERAIYGDGGPGSSGSYLDHEQANGGRKGRDSFAGQESLKAATDELAGALSIKARPEVDTSSIDAAMLKARELAATLKEVGNWTARSAQSVDQAVANTYTDYGVVP